MPNKRASTIPALDGVRGLAILLVVWSHAGPRLADYGIDLPWVLRLLTEFSYAGVDLFFVLSGFLIFLPYARALLGQAPWPSNRGFYVRRARRILPAYYAVLCVVLTLLALSGSRALSPGCRMTAGGVIQGVTLLYDTTPQTYCAMFFMDGPLWSLTIEWQFYLVLPAIALGLLALPRRGSSRRQLFAGLALLMLFGLGIRLAATLLHYALAPGRVSMPWPWTIPYAILFGANGKFLEVFALGMGAAAIYAACTRAGFQVTQRVRMLAGGAGVAGIVGLACGTVWASQAGKVLGNPAGMTNSSIVFPADPSQWPWAVWGDWTISLCFACVLMALLFVPALSHLMSFRPLRWLGRISYSVYLWHYLVLMPLPHKITWGGMPASLVGVLDLVAVWIILLVWGTISYAVIERPFLLAGGAGSAAPPSAGRPMRDAANAAAPLSRASAIWSSVEHFWTAHVTGPHAVRPPRPRGGSALPGEVGPWVATGRQRPKS